MEERICREFRIRCTFCEPEVFHSIQDHLESDIHFPAAECGAKAVMYAFSERNLVFQVVAHQFEFCCFRKLIVVVVGRGDNAVVVDMFARSLASVADGADVPWESLDVLDG